MNILKVQVRNPDNHNSKVDFSVSAILAVLLLVTLSV